MRKFFTFGVNLRIIYVLWYIASLYSIPLFIPDPNKVITDFIDMKSVLFNAVGMSFWRISVAIFFAIIISYPLGLLMATFKKADKVISPFSKAMRFIPVTIFYPLLIMWLGIGEVMKITFLFVATFFYFLPTVILIAKDIPKDMVEAARIGGASEFQILKYITFPYSLPNIFQSLIMMYGIGWTYIVIAEITNAVNGIGHIINVSSARGRTDLVFMSIIVIIIIGKLFDCLGNYISAKLFSWKN